MTFRSLVGRLYGLLALAPELAGHPQDRIRMGAYGPLLERDDGVVGDVDVLRADLLAALGDIAHRGPALAVQQAGAVEGVFGVHLQGRDAHHVARPVVLRLFTVVAEHVADVLAEEALDALAIFVDAVDVFGQHGVWRLQVRRRREWGDLAVDLVVPRHVRYQVLDQGEGAHRADVDLLTLELVDPGLAHQHRPAVDLGAAGAALGGLAVPAYGQIQGEMGLDVVDGVEHHHAFLHRHLEALLSAVAVLAPVDEQRDRAAGHAPGIQRGSCSTPLCSRRDRKSTRLNSSHDQISYAV